MSDYHISVLLDETVRALSPKSGGIYFDGTLGGGGHTQAILDYATGTRTISTDLDGHAIAHVSDRLGLDCKYDGRFDLVLSDFREVACVLDRLKVDKIDGAILDLGISSYQIDTPDKGFSYRLDGPLDMRMSMTEGVTAFEVINKYPTERLTKILFEYGEERFSRRIVSNIDKARSVKPIETTLELVDIIRKSVPNNPKDGHPAKRVFMAVRIEVNGELTGLDTAVESIVSRLKSGARLAVITFHSLEDRIIKRAFARLATDCLCDKSHPICVCKHTKEAKLIKKCRPSAAEIAGNKRSKSAMLRVLEKV